MKRSIASAYTAAAVAHSAILERQAADAHADFTKTGQELRAELLRTGLVRDLGRYGRVLAQDTTGRAHAAQTIYFDGDGNEGDLSKEALAQSSCDPAVRVELERLRGLSDAACRKVFTSYDRACMLIKEITGARLEDGYDHAN